MRWNTGVPQAEVRGDGPGCIAARSARDPPPEGERVAGPRMSPTRAMSEREQQDRRATPVSTTPTKPPFLGPWAVTLSQPQPLGLAPKVRGSQALLRPCMARVLYLAWEGGRGTGHGDITAPRTSTARPAPWPPTTTGRHGGPHFTGGDMEVAPREARSQARGARAETGPQRVAWALEKRTSSAVSPQGLPALASESGDPRGHLRSLRRQVEWGQEPRCPSRAWLRVPVLRCHSLRSRSPSALASCPSPPPAGREQREQPLLFAVVPHQGSSTLAPTCPEGPPSTAGGSLAVCAPALALIRRPWPSHPFRLSTSIRMLAADYWGGGARRPSPRGPRNLGPAQAVTSGFKPPSQAWPPWAPRTHPDTQDLPATSAHPFQALPRAAPHTLLASHQCHLHCLAPVEALVPPGQPLGGGALPPAPRRARQTDLCTHCCPPGVLLLKDPELTPPAPVGPSPWLLGTG